MLTQSYLVCVDEEQNEEDKFSQEDDQQNDEKLWIKGGRALGVQEICVACIINMEDTLLDLWDMGFLIENFVHTGCQILNTAENLKV